MGEQPKIHDELQPVAFLIGTWTGEGKGSYETAAPFAYREEITFAPAGTVLAYAQKTWHPEKGFGMHVETGYWRPKGDRIEILIVQPTGIAEILEGEIRGTTIDTRSTSVTRTTTAKEVTQIERTFTVDGDELRYQVRMAAVGLGLAPHLEATLRRAP